MTTKSDAYAFGVVLAELITGLSALVRVNKEANKIKSLISIVRAMRNACQCMSCFDFYSLPICFLQCLHHDSTK